MHRNATFYDLKISAYGVSRAEGNLAHFATTPKTMLAIALQIKQLFDTGDRLLQKGRVSTSPKYFLSDINITEGRLILLVNISDPSAPDAVSSDPESKSRVVHAKPPGHGGEHSAHVVINLSPEKGDNYYLCVVEAVYGSGLHLTSIIKFLKHVIRKCKSEFPKEYLIPNNNGARDSKGRPLMVHLLHELELQGHPSDDFQKDLEGGTLAAIQLLNFSKEGAIWDEQGGIIERQRTVDLRPKPEMIGSLGSAIRKLRANVTRADEEYKHIRIKFKTEAGIDKDATISTTTGNLVASEKYVKRHPIEAPLVNTSSFDSINSFIIREVIKLME
ncbi:hypothetical protein EQ845_22250 [Pseudomonas putida]|uniref:hypothetical protein n=1 Tax=Pseudomonas putida TaxID=303 RepID=UPI00117AF695|nr:hypothetical protein [Pseudomonas putida]TRO31726.1 hypothetical protein EQ845_22250 [Pseudomonas putida]